MNGNLGDHRKKYQLELEEMRLEPDQLTEFRGILDRLTVLAAKCRAGEPQTVGDGLFLKSLSSRLRILSFNRSSMDVAEESMARGIDVATEYLHGETLQVGVGRALPIYLLVPDGDRLVVCRGGIVSYYEVVTPIEPRWDDTAWDQNTTRLDGPGPMPWLDDAGLIHRPELDSAALDAMSRQRISSFDVGLDHRPWCYRLDDHWTTPWWIGARVDDELAPRLPELLDDEDL